MKYINYTLSIQVRQNFQIFNLSAIVTGHFVPNSFLCYELNSTA